jgi:transposase
MREVLDSKILSDDPRVLRAIIAEKDAEIAELKRQVEYLTQGLIQLKRRIFGIKSERIQEDQQTLSFYGTEAESRPEPSPPTEPRKNSKPTGKRIIPPELPRKVVVHEISPEEKTCGRCGDERREIGKDVSEHLEYVPARLFVLRNERPKYACGESRHGIAVADLPARVIEKSKAGPGLLAHILSAKYALHLPLYRLEKMFGKFGVKISRSTLSEWVGRCADILAPIHSAMRRDVLESSVIFSDDSPVRLLDPGEGKTHQARVWAYVGDYLHRQIVYEFSLTREQKWPKDFLEDFRGVLQIDGFAGYNPTLKREDVRAAYCWAHARRKFIEAAETDKERSRIATGWIGRLYDVEREIKGWHPKRKMRVRRSRSKKFLRPFRKWLDREIQKCLPKSPIGRAIQYTRKLWEGLETYTTNGRVEIDSNRVERSIRGVKLGAKNWLFFGSEDGGRWGTVIYSLTESCKIHGIDPEKYLKDVLVRVSTTPVSRIQTLMPRLWRPPPQPDSSQ